MYKNMTQRAIADAWSYYSKEDTSLYERFPYRLIQRNDSLATYAFIHPYLIMVDVALDNNDLKVHFKAENKWQALYYISLANQWDSEYRREYGFKMNENYLYTDDGSMFLYFDAICAEEESPGHWITHFFFNI